MSPRAEAAIKAFHTYQQTGNDRVLEYLSREELSGILDELSRFRDDWFYPLMERRLAMLSPVATPTEGKPKKKWGLWAVIILCFLPGLRADDMGDLPVQTARSIPNILPDPSLTPGEVNPLLTKEKICSPSFRTGPYRHVTLAQKKRIAKSYGLDFPATSQQVEYDHLISLELGGANTDKNLWPEFYLPVPGAHQKDLVENFLHKQVCSDKISLEEAQQEIATDWYAVYQDHFK